MFLNSKGSNRTTGGPSFVGSNGSQNLAVGCLTENNRGIGFDAYLMLLMYDPLQEDAFGAWVSRAVIDVHTCVLCFTK